MTDDDDEILVNLAQTLGNFTDLVGGPSHALIVIKLLENLACAEETTVRDQAIESLKKVISQSKIKDRESEFFDLIKRLINANDSFTSKIAGIAIIPVCFAHMNSTNQQELIKYFSNYSNLHKVYAV